MLVALPVFTCAGIPKLSVRRSKRHTLRIRRKPAFDGHERSAHLRSLVDRRVREQAYAQNRNPRVCGGFRSRPVSRILSRVTILLCGLPGSSAGRVDGACSPCTGRGLASRRVATALVGSYPTLSPLPSASPERCFAAGGLLSVPLSVGFRRLGSPQRPALRCPDFPRATGARGHPACRTDCSRAALARFRGRLASPGGKEEL